MKCLRLICYQVFFLLMFNLSYSQKTTLLSEDFKIIIGCWQGTLIYLDYTTNKPFSMSANLDIKQIDETNNFSFANIYPEEPHANFIDTILISNHVNIINNESVKSKKKLSNGTLEIITELLGVDGNDNKQAKFKYTYILGKSVYYHKKEVQFVGTSQWITRHEYKYKPCN